MSKITGSSILITGGAGFLGSALAKALIKKDPSKILIIDNLERGLEENLADILNDPRVEFYKDDIRNGKIISSLVKRSDYIFHMAALRINACAEDPVSAFEVMNEALFHLVECARKSKIEKIIYSSSASVYGQAAHFPTTEEEPPYSNQTFYGACKLWGEQLLSSYFHMYGLPHISLRYFNVYGPGMDIYGRYTEVMIKWLDCIRRNENPVIYGDGNDSMDFIYSEDVVHSNILALESEINQGAFNIGSGKETSLNELLKNILEINNSDLEPEYRNENIINPVKRRLASTQKAENDLGFNAAHDLNEGLKKLSGWYFEKHSS